MGEIKITNDGTTDFTVENAGKLDIMATFGFCSNAPFIMCFHGKDNTEIGRLEEKDGRIVFTGDADECANKLFEAFDRRVFKAIREAEEKAVV